MQKISDSFKKRYGILIVIIVIFILASGVIFSQNYVIINDYSGLKIYNIDTTTELKWVYNIRQIKRLKNLQSLRIGIQDQKDDLSFLKSFDYLTYLHLSDETRSRISDLDTLPVIPNLNTLSLANFESEKLDCSPVGQLSSLEKLYAADCNISDWNFVDNLPNLKFISYVNGYNDTEAFNKRDWTPLESVSSLEYFEVKNVCYDKTLLDILEKLPSLDHVYIAFYESRKLSDEEHTYIFDWIERMEDKGIECQVVDFNYHG